MVTLVVLFLCTATTQGTPAQPDFSGQWLLDAPMPANPDTTRRLVVLQPITRTNVFGEPVTPAFLRITIRRESEHRGWPHAWSVERGCPTRKLHSF